MSERDGYQRGVPCWIAGAYPDPDEASRFYAELFGWEATNLTPPGSSAKYFLCRLRGRDVAAIVSQQGAPQAPKPAWGTYIWVETADEAAARAVAAGGGIAAEPFDSAGGARTAVLSDSSGALFGVWQPKERRGAGIINEAGAWSMSSLNTGEPDEAKQFYGTVFGWETDMFRLGESEVTLWRVRGYVGGEPEQPVPRDLVAVMVPTPGGAEPHWSVDFWVDDVDATAAKAAELGGDVVVPPYDIPGFRQAVLADSQGAAFSVSRVTVGAP